LNLPCYNDLVEFTIHSQLGELPEMGNKLGMVWGPIKFRLPIVLLSFILIVLMELLNRGQLLAPLTWGVGHVAEFVLDLLIVCSLFLFFTAIIGRTRIAFWVLSSLLLILSLISGVKMKMLGVPLLPWDFVLSGETQDMVQYLNNIINPLIIISILLFIGIIYFIMHRTDLVQKNVNWLERGIMALAALLLIAVMYTDKPVPIKKWLGVSGQPWDQGENAKSNGFALATLMNMEMLFINEKEGYDDQAIAAIVDQSEQLVEAGSGVKPNVIVVLSESFWDPTLIKSAKFSKDPIPFFHKMQETQTSGWMLSPQFGGGTANVEFEVLTGNSMRFLPQGSLAYNQYINQEVDSMASILARQGYTSTAISPFHNWYFNSKTVYQNFGFSKFIPIEYFNPNYVGPYIADSEVTANIIAESSKSPGPDFIFANTMENHFHFYPGKFAKNTIEVTGDFSPESKGMLETLSQGILDADKMLQDLVEHYSKLNEPTVVVFFGDHLPALGDDYQVYKDTKYISGNDDPDFLNKIYRVPFVIWNNFSNNAKDKLEISPSFLSPYILKLAGQQGSYYTDYLQELSQKIPVIPPKNYYEAMNIKEEDLKNYETLQYDILFGERHAYKDFRDKIIDKNYILGFGPMTIDHVSSDISGDSSQTAVTLTLKGANLPALCVLSLNGKPVPTTWVDQQTVTAKVEKTLMKSGNWELQLKVSDSKENVIGKSNTYSFQMGASE
jgi:phosphoglycerol transferase MdoB-like AlkP superfamily enzyme